ncbi:MAG: hypothetical protein K2M60_03425 [Lachnospiraceae bacterium]|nr:hypothetical protein [Lachnospiraceae bacterium]MDE6251714.1 hypothetical protein [Lachnospiraceae bacterium]
MSREKQEKNVRNVPITVRLNEEESKKLKQCAAACGLSAAGFMRQICMGKEPQPQPVKEFWELLNTLYEVHAAFKKCVPYFPSAAEICKEIEQLVVDLQQEFTMPQKINVEEFIQKGAV